MRNPEPTALGPSCGFHPSACGASRRPSFAQDGAKCPLELGYSWVVISRVISPLIWAISIVTLLITPLITTHEPLSSNHVMGDFQSCKQV